MGGIGCLWLLLLLLFVVVLVSIRLLQLKRHVVNFHQAILNNNMLWISTLITTHFLLNGCARGHFLSPAYDHRKHRPYWTRLFGSTGGHRGWNGWCGWCNAMVTSGGRCFLCNIPCWTCTFVWKIEVKTLHLERAGTCQNCGMIYIKWL